MNREEATQILAVLKAAYPMFQKDVSGGSLELTINVWAEALKDTSFKYAQHAVMQHIKKEKWPPSIAEVISAERELNPETSLFAMAVMSIGRLEENNKSENKRVQRLE